MTSKTEVELLIRQIERAIEEDGTGRAIFMLALSSAAGAWRLPAGEERERLVEEARNLLAAGRLE